MSSEMASSGKSVGDKYTEGSLQAEWKTKVANLRETNRALYNKKLDEMKEKYGLKFDTNDDSKNDALLATVWKTDPTFLSLDLGGGGAQASAIGATKLPGPNTDKKTPKHFQGLLSPKELKDASAPTLEKLTSDLSIAIKSNPIPWIAEFVENGMIRVFDALRKSFHLRAEKASKSHHGAPGIHEPGEGKDGNVDVNWLMAVLGFRHNCIKCIRNMCQTKPGLKRFYELFDTEVAKRRDGDRVSINASNLECLGYLIKCLEVDVYKSNSSAYNKALLVCQDVLSFLNPMAKIHDPKFLLRNGKYAEIVYYPIILEAFACNAVNGFKILSRHYEDKLYGLNTQCERFYPIRILFDDIFLDAKLYLNSLLATQPPPSSTVRRSPSIPSSSTVNTDDNSTVIPVSYNTVNPRMKAGAHFLATAGVGGLVSGGEFSKVKYQILKVLVSCLCTLFDEFSKEKKWLYMMTIREELRQMNVFNKIEEIRDMLEPFYPDDPGEKDESGSGIESTISSQSSSQSRLPSPSSPGLSDAEVQLYAECEFLINDVTESIVGHMTPENLVTTFETVPMLGSCAGLAEYLQCIIQDTTAEPYIMHIMQLLVILSVAKGDLYRMRRLRWITEIISQYTLNYDGTSYSDFSHGFTFNFSAPSDGPSRKSAGGTLMGGTMTNFTDMMAYEGSGSYVDEMEARMWQNIENRMAVMEQNIGAKRPANTPGEILPSVPSKPTPVAPPEAPPVATPSIDVPVAPPVGAPPPPGPPPPPPPGGPGAPPPPPPPGGPAAPKKQRHKFLPERADFKSKLPNQTMKVYWKKLDVEKLNEKSVWIKITESVDDKTIKTLAKTFSSSSKPSKFDESDGGSSKGPKKEVTFYLLDSESSMAIDIFLNSRKLTTEDVKRALWSLDSEILGESTLKELRSKLINKEGENLCLKMIDFKDFELQPSEKFLLNMSEVKDVAVRTENMLFTMQFESDVQPIKEDASIMYKACRELNESPAFLQFLKMSLAFGNILNTGHKLSRAYGYDLQYLKEWRGVKTSIDKSKTMIHFFCESLPQPPNGQRHPTLVQDLINQLYNVKLASSVDEETIQSRTDSIKSKLQRLSTLLENKKPLKKEDQFVDKMKDFEKKAGGQLEGIDKLITNYKKEFSKVVINFFMEDAKLNVKELFESIAIFLNDLQECSEEIVKEREDKAKEEKKKKEQEEAALKKKNKPKANRPCDISDMKEDQTDILDMLGKHSSAIQKMRQKRNRITKEKATGADSQAIPNILKRNQLNVRESFMVHHPR